MKQFLIAAFMLMALLPALASASDEAAAEGDKAASNKPVYYALDPAFVVNVTDSGRRRFMQVKIQVQLDKQGSEGDLEHHDPAIRDAMIMLLAHVDVAKMRTPKGREEVRAEALKAIQDVMVANAGKPEIQAVYFTDFVIQ